MPDFSPISLITGLLAYLGPGLGAGVVAAILGILASIFLALFAILWYPFKRFLKKRKKQKTETASPPEKP